MSNALQRFEMQVLQAWPADGWRDVHVLLAVSGGPDSVALLRAALAIKRAAGGRGRLHVAHLNHLIRGPDAETDQHWLEALCERLHVPLHVGHSDISALAAVEGDGLEAAARSARYDYLLRTAERIGARSVAVAHTTDDQVETILHRIVRGTGLTGLGGMRSARPLSATVTLVRPLLGCRRHEVLTYLEEIGQDYRHDTTNDDTRFTRNRLRRLLIPMLRAEFNTNVDQALMRLAQQADETQQVVATFVQGLVRQCVTTKYANPASGPTTDSACAVTVQIECQPLEEQPETLVREVCRAAWNQAGWPQQGMGFAQWRQLTSMVMADPDAAAVTLPGGIRASRAASMIVLERPQSAMQ